MIGFIISSTTIRESLFNLLGDYGMEADVTPGEIFAEQCLRRKIHLILIVHT